jgi:hypothetical protein
MIVKVGDPSVFGPQIHVILAHKAGVFKPMWVQYREDLGPSDSREELFARLTLKVANDPMFRRKYEQWNFSVARIDDQMTIRDGKLVPCK